ncbi:hypothetical protein [Demequina iriomotensis]|uniref:hypothetical protein n=1 Tax=Demequina iriomotensis TaxID=1536641 RepID=UPI000785FCC5|nr:hypothetical protein [Demequina iriomotensis]
MGGIENLRPVVVPDGVIELRIHGVSGTPPEGLLAEPPILVAGGGDTGFYRGAAHVGRIAKAGEPGFVEAYSWGGLTSGGRVRSALRVLLLPFALINVAGWMLPGVWASAPEAETASDKDDATTLADRRPTVPTEVDARTMQRSAWHTFAARVIALCMTAIATMGAYWVASIAVERGTKPFGSNTGISEEWRAAIALGVAVLALLGWSLIAMRRSDKRVQRQGAAPTEAMVRSPATAPKKEGISVARLWSAGALTRSLSHIHTLAGLGVASLLYATETDSARPFYVGVGYVALSVIALVVEAVKGALIRLPKGVRPLAYAVVVTVGVWTAWGTSTAGARLSSLAEPLGKGFLTVALLAFALTLVQAGFAPDGGPTIARWHSAIFATLGFATAVTGVSGSAVVLNRVLDGAAAHTPPTPVMLIAAFAGVLTVCVLACGVLWRWNATKGVGTTEWFKGLRKLAEKARSVLGVAALAFGAVVVLGLVVGVIVVMPGEAPEPGSLAAGFGWGALGWIPVAAVVGFLAASRIRRNVAKGAVACVTTAAALAGALGLWHWALVALGKNSKEEAFGLASSHADDAFATFSILAAFVTPLAAVGLFMFRGSASVGIRRPVGVIWDLVSLWPRFFHPWAPVPYSDTTFPDLQERVTALLANDAKATVIVSAHSQGAIIALPALQGLQGTSATTAVPGKDRLRLLTYGQLLNVHYRWLFPWIFNPHLFADVGTLVRNEERTGWINLYRQTDPLGHPVNDPPGEDDWENVPDPPTPDEDPYSFTPGPPGKPRTLNHGNYQYGARYEEALKELSRTGASTPDAPPEYVI